MMGREKLDQYRGRLSAAQIAEGMNEAERNARRLLADAKTLAAAERYPSAVAIAILAVEEAGKVSILRMMSACADDASLKRAWKDYRSHRAKNAHSMVPALVARGARKLDDFRPAFDAEADHTTKLDMLKQIAIYTDCLGSAHWSVPQHVADKDVAEAVIRDVEFMVPKRDDHMHSEREIELWREHIAPVLHRPLEWMKTALLNWHQAMIAEGLTDVDLQSAERFVRGPGLDEPR